MRRSFRPLATIGLLTAGLLGTGSGAQAAITATLGPPTGNTFETFNSLVIPSGGLTPSGIEVSFTGTAPNEGRSVLGEDSGIYAPPRIVAGANFGQVDGTIDTTVYLSSGRVIADPASSFVLDLPAPTTYLGFLWGSVDTYNNLQFFLGNSLVPVETYSGALLASETGAIADGQNSYYVNFNTTSLFHRVVGTSTLQFAFEIDNASINSINAVPEPSTMIAAASGIVLLGASGLRRSPCCA